MSEDRDGMIVQVDCNTCVRAHGVLPQHKKHHSKHTISRVDRLRAKRTKKVFVTKVRNLITDLANAAAEYEKVHKFNRQLTVSRFTV